MADLQAEMSVSDFQWPRQILHKKCGKDLKGGGEGGGSAKAPTTAQVQLLQWKELTETWKPSKMHLIHNHDCTPVERGETLTDHRQI